MTTKRTVADLVASLDRRVIDYAARSALKYTRIAADHLPAAHPARAHLDAAEAELRGFLGVWER